MTRFTFTCTAAPADMTTKPRYEDFILPSNVWAIGVDDSKIQRKLLGRIFEHVGVDESRQLMLGESPDDIAELEATLTNFLEEHPGDRALVVVDEHLVRNISIPSLVYFVVQALSQNSGITRIMTKLIRSTKGECTLGQM